MSWKFCVNLHSLQNAEEFTEEGLPFLILFYEPGDNDNIKKYSDVIQRELLDEKREFKLSSHYNMRL